MIEITGKYATAKVLTEILEVSAHGQIQSLCEQAFVQGSKIRIMPDVHAGKGCTIGTTMTIRDSVVLNLVGVDIGCGMEIVKLKAKRLNLPELDSFIRKNIPSGREVRERAHRSHGRIDIGKLRCVGKLDTRRAEQSLGSLGGGNHFIEVTKDDNDLYLLIHSGSHNLGLQVAEHLEKYDIYLKFKGKKTLSEADKALLKEAHSHLKKVMNGHSSLPVNAWKTECAKLNAEQKTLNQRYLTLKNEVKEAEQIRRSVYDILWQEQLERQPHRAQDMDR